MKKLFLAIVLALRVQGCSKKNEITIACEEGFDCPEITEAVEKYYDEKGVGDSVTVTETDRNKLLSNEYTVEIGSRPMGDPLDYGMWKSRPIKYEIACIISRDEYRMTTDLESLKVGIPKDFEYVRFISLPENTEVSGYSDKGSLISDLNEGVIDAAICSDEVGAEIAAAISGARINNLSDSNIYEYVVMSEDIDLINSLDAVIK